MNITLGLLFSFITFSTVYTMENNTDSFTINLKADFNIANDGVFLLKDEVRMHERDTLYAISFKDEFPKKKAILNNVLGIKYNNESIFAPRSTTKVSPIKHIFNTPYQQSNISLNVGRSSCWDCNDTHIVINNNNDEPKKIILYTIANEDCRIFSLDYSPIKVTINGASTHIVTQKNRNHLDIWDIKDTTKPTTYTSTSPITVITPTQNGIITGSSSGEITEYTFTNNSQKIIKNSDNHKIVNVKKWNNYVVALVDENPDIFKYNYKMIFLNANHSVAHTFVVPSSYNAMMQSQEITDFGINNTTFILGNSNGFKLYTIAKN